MNTTSKPSKETVRTWLNQRAASREPLPDRETIRRQLGWNLMVQVPQQRVR